MPATRARPARSPRHQNVARLPRRRDTSMASRPRCAPGSHYRLWRARKSCRRLHSAPPGAALAQPSRPSPLSSQLSLRPPQVKAKSSAGGPALSPAPLHSSPPRAQPTRPAHSSARAPAPDTDPRTNTGTSTQTHVHKYRPMCANMQHETHRTLHRHIETHVHRGTCVQPPRKRNQSREGSTLAMPRVSWRQLDGV